MTPPLHTLRRAQVALAAAVLWAVIDGAPSDRALAAELKRGPRLGARDRRWVGALVYGVLRRVVHLRDCHGAAPELWLAQWLRAEHDADDAALERLDLPIVAPVPLPATRGAQRNWPEWLDRAAEALGDEPACDRLAEALRREAPTDMRVNTLRGTREAAQALLAEDGIDAEPVPEVPTALRLARRQPLQHSRAWREGWIEPQDAGSQLLCALLDARPGERIADWCAGAGGKALAIAALQQDRGEIVALDSDARRLARIAPRAQRLGVRSIRTLALPAAEDPGRFDAVLVDAPCSGSGTLRRRPELALRHIDLEAMTRTQRDILDAAAAQLRPGGRLVYATCSFLPQENEAVVDGFAAAHPEFTVQQRLRIGPETHGCDAFCAALLRRAADARQ